MTVLPWQPETTPLMLAPMQGLTNRALRAYFIEHVRSAADGGRVLGETGAAGLMLG